MENIFEKFFTRMTENRQSQFFQQRQPQKGGTIKALVIVLIVFLIVEYFVLIPINLRSPDFVFFFSILLVIFIALRSLFQASFDKVNKILSVVIALLLVYVFAGQLISSPIFFASSYQKQLDVDKNADFYKDNPKVNYQSIPVVDKESAERLGDRKMGEIVDYVSQFEVDNDYVQINYQDKPYRVTTLSYSDLIKWFTNHRE